MASVIHGFIYNKKAFEEVGVTPPTTEAEFFAVLDKIKANGSYIPMAMGTNDQWEAATMGYQNIGPNYWKGEEGRLALIKGEQKLTDDDWVQPFREIAKWKDYLGDGFEAQTYPDSQNLFTLGRAAIYPAGSWEIAPFRTQIADAFEMGAFPPPVPNAGDPCYISDHVDIAMGLNAASKNADAAKQFLEWVGSAEFAELYANALPGLLPAPQPAGEDRRPAGAGVRLLAREVQVDDPLDLPDPLARHAEPRERDLERLRQRDPRQRDPGGRRQAVAGRPRKLVRPAEAVAAAGPAPRGRGLFRESDLMDREWALIEPHQQRRDDDPDRRSTDFRSNVDAILYIPSRSGRWRAPPT